MFRRMSLFTEPRDLAGDLVRHVERSLTRRAFLTRSTTGVGLMALGSLLNRTTAAAPAASPSLHGALSTLHSAPKAKRVIYIFQSGAPSHLDLFDYKPKLRDMTGEELPPSVRMGQRITGMTAGQAVLKAGLPLLAEVLRDRLPGVGHWPLDGAPLAWQILAALLWYATLLSGVHATIAGVLAA